MSCQRDTHGSVSSFFELTLRLVVQAIQRQDPSEELYTMLDLILTPTCHLYVRAIDTRSPLAEGGAGKENKAERWDAAGPRPFRGLRLTPLPLTV